MVVRRAQAGDLAAFDALVHRYAEPVFRLALGMLGSHTEAEDVQQETFIAAYRHLRAFRGEASILSWLYGIAVRLCLQRLRRASRRDTQLNETILEDCRTHNPEQHLLACEEADRVQHALHCLAPADRLLIVLKHLEGLSHEEIAAVLGCSVASSRVRLNRARKLFREHY
jgi:RNA polymerase sigma-70 factor (ECF subfamily)